MKKTFLKRMFCFIVCTVLIAAMAFCITGCKSKTIDLDYTDVTVTTVGEGETVFDFTVIDKDGNTTAFKVKTNKATVGEALLDLGLIEGEQGDYGLYVKTVNGITLDYNTDGKYWAFYVNGEYASAGVDTTPINKSETYTFKAE